MKICVVDYKAGNLGSLGSALRDLELDFTITSDKQDLNKADLIIIPGVGSFKYGMENLSKLDLDKAIIQHSEKELPILGICLGMHLLGTQGYEGGHTKGLNLIPGEIKILVPEETERVPHIGWDLIETKTDRLYVYFAHSYYFDPKKDQETEVFSSFSTTRRTYAAGIRRKNIVGVQFHPEKSGRAGLLLLETLIKG